jgi:hypothetical protein
VLSGQGARRRPRPGAGGGASLRRKEAGNVGAQRRPGPGPQRRWRPRGSRRLGRRQAVACGGDEWQRVGAGACELAWARMSGPARMFSSCENSLTFGGPSSFNGPGGKPTKNNITFDGPKIFCGAVA